MTKWLVSHASAGPDNTPTFFKALDSFGSEHPNISVIFPPDPPLNFADHKKQIDEADLMIAEVSIASTGSGIDLGLAHAAGKDVIAFHQGTSITSPIVPIVATALHAYITPEDIAKILETLA